MKLITATVSLFALTSPALALAATTLRVPGDYPTVSAAVTAAADGDTVLIADGTYASAADTTLTTSASITIASVNGAATTVIDGATNPGQWFVEGTTTVRGITFRNGKDQAAVRVSGTATIDGCTFSHTSNGSGLLIGNATAVVTGCTFDHNAANFGGGLAVTSSSVTVSRSTFDTNSAASGGGAVSLSASTATLDGCTFTDNSAYFGGAVFCQGSASAASCIVRNSTLTNNTGVVGGAFSLNQSGSTAVAATVIDSIVAQNHASSDGGITAFSPNNSGAQSFSAVNTTFVNNTAPSSTTGLFANTGNLSLQNVIIVNDTTTAVQSTSAPLASYTAITSDVQAFDPHFLDAANGDFRIPSTSAAAFTGTASGAPLADFAGHAWDGGVSMGALAAVHVASLVATGPTSVVAGTPFVLSVKAVDQFGGVFTSYDGTIHVTSSDAAAVLPADTALVSGAGSVSITLATVGAQTLHFTGDGDLAGDAAVTVTAAPVPDLTIAMTRGDAFGQSSSVGPYRVVVTNSGSAATSGPVTVVFVVPGSEQIGPAALVFTGDGWTCNRGTTATCTRNDVLASGAAYPAITLDGNVVASTDATISVTTTATVSGGGEVDTSNDVASDTASVGPFPTGIGLALPADDGCSASGGSFELVLAALFVLKTRRRARR